MLRAMVRIAAVAAACGVLAMTVAAQAPEAKKGRGGGGARMAPPVPDDMAGFEAIFDGKTLNGWEGDTMFWRAENGIITGESTPEKVVKLNTFLIWRGGTTKDFELKAEFRITDPGNSGIQYRSAPLKDVGPFVLKGYQADIDGAHRYTGMLYEERGRGFLAERGRMTRMAPGKVRKLIASPGDGEELKGLLKTGAEWNQVHIVARGTTIIHVINGRVMSIFLDDDPEGRAAEGLLGLQMHVGPPMKIEFRNVMLKRL